MRRDCIGDRAAHVDIDRIADCPAARCRAAGRSGGGRARPVGERHARWRCIADQGTRHVVGAQVPRHDLVGRGGAGAHGGLVVGLADRQISRAIDCQRSHRGLQVADALRRGKGPRRQRIDHVASSIGDHVEFERTGCPCIDLRTGQSCTRCSRRCCQSKRPPAPCPGKRCRGRAGNCHTGRQSIRQCRTSQRDIAGIGVDELDIDRAWRTQHHIGWRKGFVDGDIGDVGVDHTKCCNGCTIAETAAARRKSGIPWPFVGGDCIGGNGIGQRADWCSGRDLYFEGDAATCV
ncbi:hypothetical protein D3C72_1348740 [compost metagenome]